MAYLREHLRSMRGLVLGVSALIAVVLSLLTEVPEVWALGYEMGVLIGGLAFAYLGAWIFHWVAIEMPRLRQADRTYEATWPILSQLSTNGPALLNELNAVAYGWDSGEPMNAKELQEFGGRIWCGPQLSRFDRRIINPGRCIRNRIKFHQGQMRAIGPYVHLLDGEVAEVLVAMACSMNIASLRGAKLEAEVLRVGLGNRRWEDRRQTVASTHSAHYLAEYVDLCRRLRSALEAAQPHREVKWVMYSMGADADSWGKADSDSSDPENRLLDYELDNEWEMPDLYLD